VPKRLLPVPHHKQQGDGDCLAACAAMVLSYLNHQINYPQLLDLLKIRPYGAPAGNIRLLENQNLTVTYQVTDMAGMEAMLKSGNPVIVFMRTSELPYWDYATDHALVVVGFDESNIYINDPYFDNAPITVPRDEFELAWLERDYYYATITKVDD
jgi:ABC-type bacteriocin/lantibiotic exporter with double-glycine peptidase domain